MIITVLEISEHTMGNFIAMYNGQLCACQLSNPTRDMAILKRSKGKTIEVIATQNRSAHFLITSIK